MPLYTYRCKACDQLSEMLVRSSDTPECPACGSRDLERQIGATAPPGKSGAVLKNARAAAAREGHFSNYSRAERGKL